MQVRWEQVNPATYERMAAVLLSRLDPRTERIDGSGGDGGRDVMLRDDRGIRAFELKSFTGRLARGRRAQVERSLERASLHRPVEWTLIVPVDPNPSELKWFDGLKARYRFPLFWRGRTWLDGEMAAHPEIHHYFMQGASDEVMQLLRELHKEEARPESALAAVERARVLQGRLNEIDPYYTFELVIGPSAASSASAAAFSANYGDVRVDVYPRYAGATRDRPITLGLEFVIGPDDTEMRDAVTKTIDYGAPLKVEGPALRRVKIDAPGGLGVDLAGGVVEITPRKLGVPPIRMTAEVATGDQIVGSIPIDFRPAHAGRRGAVLRGTDPSGWLDVSVTIDTAARRFQLKLSAGQKPVLPGIALATLRWLRHLQAPNLLWLRGPIWSLKEPARLENDTLIADGFVELVEALDDLQRASGVYFDLPVGLTAAEVRSIVTARRLLTGEALSGTWSAQDPVELRLKKGVKPGFDRILSMEGAALLIEADESIELRGHVLPIGPVRTMIKAARVADIEAARRRLASGHAFTLRLVPGSDASITRQRITRALVPDRDDPG